MTKTHEVLTLGPRVRMQVCLLAPLLPSEPVHGVWARNPDTTVLGETKGGGRCSVFTNFKLLASQGESRGRAGG